ncbi:MAG TPA: helix-turn-helix domain-containing protein [Ruminiclostridium sp.]|nr:helix-turn-helix domain-containing protein [Ruminiclostridium sp.]
MASKGQKFRKWSVEEKQRIVKRHTEDHVSVRQLSKEEGATDGMICRWVQEYEEAGEEGLQPRKRTGNPYAALSTSKSLTEIERLQLLVAKQEIEIERLKKGYWVEGVGANKEYVTGCGKSTKSPKLSK